MENSDADHSGQKRMHHLIKSNGAAQYLSGTVLIPSTDSTKSPDEKR